MQSTTSITYCNLLNMSYFTFSINQSINKANQPAPIRTKAMRKELIHSLCSVFPEHENIVHAVIDRNHHIIDIEEMFDFVVQALCDQNM